MNSHDLEFKKSVAKAAIPQQIDIDSGRFRAECERAKCTPIKRPIKGQGIDDSDAEMIELIGHCLVHQGRRLSLGEFYSKYGLSKLQARAMTAAEISAHCLQQEKNDVENPDSFRAAWQPRAVPSKYFIE